jgi:hypothetical protein
VITLARFVSLIALVGTIVPAVLLVAGRLDLSSMKWWMLVSAVAWFAATPVWMDRDTAGPKGSADADKGGR